MTSVIYKLILVHNELAEEASWSQNEFLVNNLKHALLTFQHESGQ